MNLPSVKIGFTVGTTGSNSTVVFEIATMRTNWAAWATARKRFHRRSERERSGEMAAGDDDWDMGSGLLGVFIPTSAEAAGWMGPGIGRSRA